MNIKEFKVGDIITRNEPMVYKHNDSGDSSYCGDRNILRGHDEVSKIIFFDSSGVIEGIQSLSYARDAWDEGWCLYPETLWQLLKRKIRVK